MKKDTQRNFIREVVIVTLLGLALLYPRLQQLGKYIFIDETYYLKHGAQFYWAIANQEFDKTDLVVHPGVTTNWLGASAFRLFFPEYAEKQKSSAIADLQFRRILEKNDLSMIYMLIWARAGVAGFNAVMLVLAFLLARRLFNPWLAALGVLLAGFDPFYFDYSRFLHVDGILSTLMLVSSLAFLVYLKEHRWGWLLLSGVLAGLSVLTKVPGILMLGMVGLFGLIDWARRENNAFGAPRSWRGLASLAGKVGIWLAVLLLVVFLVWPAMWVDPIGRLARISAFVLDQGSAEVISPMFFNGEQNPTGVFGWEYAYYYPLSYLWRASPVTLAGLALLAGAYFFRKKLAEKEIAWDVVGKLLLFVAVYAVLMTVSVKKFDRYILPAVLPLNVLAGAGFYVWIRSGIDALVSGGAQSRLRQAVLGLGVLAIVGLQGWQVYSVFPYGLSYYNPLMGGGEKAADVMMVGYGEGLDQAAAYMMTVPNKRNLTIYSFYSNAFGFHFMHQIDEILWYEDEIPEPMLEADYWIVYRSQRQRGMSEVIFEMLEGHQPEHTVVINGIEYAWVYKLAEIREK